MKTFVIRRLQAEYHHFLDLGDKSRRLLFSYAFFALVNPLIFGFINAFLFRENQNFTSVVLYNTGFFISIPFFFYVNGHLLQRFSLKRLYQMGLIGQGLVLNVLFFIPTKSWLGLVGFGLIQGLFVGIYWANRNFLTIEITTDKTRQLFVGLEQIFAVFSELLAPLMIGAVITLGAVTAFFTPQEGYKILGFISLLLLITAAKVLGSVSVATPKVKKFLVTKASAQWSYIRIAEVIYGSFHGVNMFLPSLLVFKLIGEEGVMGVLQSIAALFTAFIVYYLSRKLKPSERVKITALVIVILLLISIFLSLSFTATTAILLIVLAPAINKVRWQTWNPTVMSAIDAQDNGDRNTNYAYIVDREIFLNGGRLVGVAIFVVALTFISETAAIRFSPLLIGIVQLLFIYAMKMVIALHPSNKKMRGEEIVVGTTAEAA